MQFYSLNGKSPSVSFAEAAMQGQAPDGGLYFPSEIPQHNWLHSNEWKHRSLVEIGVDIMRPYCAGSLPPEVLENIVYETLCFPFPLCELTSEVYVLELFHGPTLAFKDVGARFMSRCLEHLNKDGDKKMTVLVATSGDTGGAVAAGFAGIEGVEVVILYPAGKVSPVQEMQLTTWGGNIRALKLSGSFDDCQAIVKQAFQDKDLNEKYRLTSANSINVARWLPQQLYYASAMQQWQQDVEPVISVPSGNFGNLCAGMLLQQGGLPVKQFVAACNANDVVVDYLHGSAMDDRKTIATLSNAMDVARPSNFVRIMQMFEHDRKKLSAQLAAYSVSDEETVSTMQHACSQLQYIADPHGAVALYALLQYLEKHPGNKGMFLETAHPIKFPDTVAHAINELPYMPEEVRDLYQKPQHVTELAADYDSFKALMMG